MNNQININKDLVSGNQNQSNGDSNKHERYHSPQPISNSQNLANTGHIYHSQQYQDINQQGNIGGGSSVEFIRSNGFSKSQQYNREGNTFSCPRNTSNQINSSSQKYNSNDKYGSNLRQRNAPTSPINKNNQRIGQGFSKDDFEYIIKEQVDYVRKKYLNHFTEILAQLNIHIENPRIENQNDETSILLKIREEFTKIVNKYTGFKTLISELRQRVEFKESELKEKQNEIEDLKQKVIQTEQKIDNNPKIVKLDEQIQQLRSEIKIKNEEKKPLQIKITQLEEDKLDNQRRERLYLEDIDRLKDELFMVLDNIKNMMEYFGIFDESDERNVDNMLNILREYLAKNIEKVHLHKNVFEDMEKKILENQDEIENLKYQNIELLKQIDDLDDINRSLKDQLDLTQLQNQEGQSLDQGIRDKIMKMQNENNVFKKNHIDHEMFEKFESDKKETSHQLQERNEVIINMKNEISSLEQKVADKEKQIKKLQHELADIKGEKNHQEKIVKSLEQIQHDKKARNDEILEKVIEMEKIQRKLNKRNLELEEEVKKYKDMAKKRNDQQPEKLKKYDDDDKYQDLIKKVKDFERINQNSNQKIGEQREHIATLETQITNLKRDLQSEKGQQEKIQTNIEKVHEKQQQQVEQTQQQHIQQLQKEKEDAINAERQKFEQQQKQIEQSQQQYIQQIKKEKEDAIVAERQKYEKDIEITRNQNVNEEKIREKKIQDISQELQQRNEQIKQLQKQLQDMKKEIENSSEQIKEEKQLWNKDQEEKRKQEGIDMEKRIESEKKKISDQFEKLLKDQSSNFDKEKTQQNELLLKEIKAVESKYKEREEENARENKKVYELSQMELNGLKESNEEFQSAIEKLKIELKQANIRENDLKSENESMKTKIEGIESNVSAENKTIVNGLQLEKRQLEQTISQLKRNNELYESQISELNQKIVKLQEENENICQDRSNLIYELQNEKKQASNQQHEDEQQIEQQQQTIFKQNNYAKDLENEINKWRSQVDQLNEDNKLITSENIQLNQRITELSQQNQEKENNIQNIIKKQEDTINQLRKDHQANLEQVIHQSKGELVDSFQKQINTLENQIENMNKQNQQNINQNEQTKNNLQNQIQQQNEQIKQKELQIEEINQNYLQQIQVLNEQIQFKDKQIQETNNNLNQQISNLNQSVSQKDSQIDQINNSLIMQIQQLNEQNIVKDKQIEEINKKYQENINKLNKDHQIKLDESINKFRNEASINLSQETNNLGQQILQLKDQNLQIQKQLEQNLKASEEAIHQLKRDHQAKLEETINKTRAETSESYKQQIQTLERQLNVLQETQNQTAQSQTNKLSQEINILNQQIMKLQQENTHLNDQKTDSLNENDKLKSIIEDLEQNLQKEALQKEGLQKKLNQLDVDNSSLNSKISQQKQKENDIIIELQQENSQLQDQVSDLNIQIQQLQENIQIELQKQQKKEEINKTSQQKQQENDIIIQLQLENNQLLDQINDLNNQIQKLQENVQSEPQQNQQNNEEIFGFEDFADDLAGSQQNKDLSRRVDTEKRSEPSQIGIAQSGGFKLNFANIQNNPDNDADRLHIKRNLDRKESPTQSQQSPKEINYDSFGDDDMDSSQVKSKFKDQIIQEQGKKIENMTNELQNKDFEIQNCLNENNDLKQQIDQMFEDLNQANGYIQHLEQMVDQLNVEKEQLVLSLQQQEGPKKDMKQKTHSIDDGSVSPNTRILTLKSKLAQDQEDREIFEIENNAQIIKLNEEIKNMKVQLRELMEKNDDLENIIEEKDNKILDLQDNQHGEGAEEEIGQLNEINDKLKQKVRRHEEDIQYLQQVNQNQNNLIQELQSQLKKSGLNKNPPGSESGKSGEDDDYEGGLVQELVKTGGQQFNKEPKKQQKKVLSDHEMNEDFDNDESPHKNPKTMNTAEAEQYESYLINEKIRIQQQISELKNDDGNIQTEDQIHIQELQHKLEYIKKQIQLLHERPSNRNKPKHEISQLNDRYLHLQQQFKELKEEKENLALDNKNLQNQLSNALQSPQANTKKVQSESSGTSITMSEQIDMLKLSLADAQSQLKVMKSKYNNGIQKIKQMMEAPSFSATQPAETEEDIVLLAEQLAINHQQKMQQLQAQFTHSDAMSSHKSPVFSHEINENDDQIKSHDITSLKAFVLYSQKLESIIEEALLNKMLGSKDQMNKKDLTSDQFEKIQSYLRILNDFQIKLSEKEKENLELQEKVSKQADELAKIQKPQSASNRNFIQEGGKRPSQQQDPFQLNDFENISKDMGENNNNENNESSFMSEQIIKELEGTNAKTPQNQASMNQQSQIQKQQEEDMNKLMKENSELKASKDYFASRQDELYDELRAKEEIIQTTEQTIKTLKKEVRKLKEQTDAVSQKEHLKTIFIQFVKAVADKKRQLEADNFLNILFSMLGITDVEKEDIINTIAKKSSDKKKSIVQLITQK